jgi:hypothetical protein
MNWMIGAAATAVVLVPAVGGWAWSRRHVRRIASPEEVAAAANGALHRFETVDAVVGADGTGALAVGRDGRVAAVVGADRDGRVAAVRRRGRRLAVREVGWHAVRPTGQGMVVEGDGRFKAVVLTGVDVLDIRRLAPSVKRRAGPARADDAATAEPPGEGSIAPGTP